MAGSMAVVDATSATEFVTHQALNIHPQQISRFGVGSRASQMAYWQIDRMKGSVFMHMEPQTRLLCRYIFAVKRASWCLSGPVDCASACTVLALVKSASSLGTIPTFSLIRMPVVFHG